MYWPCNLRAARRADDSLSLRPRPDGFPESRVAASSAGANRPSVLAIVASDLLIVRTSLLTDRRRVLRKPTSKAEMTAESYYGAPPPGLSASRLPFPRWVRVRPMRERPRVPRSE